MSAMSLRESLLGALLPLVGRRRPPTRNDHPPLDGMHNVTRGGVSYLRAGPSGARRLILVHGTPGRACQWADYLLQSPGNFESIAIDRPGFGDSGPAGPVVSLREQAAAIAALLGTAAQPSILLGHSLGGAVVAEVAAQYPTQVAAAVLVAAAADPALECTHPLQHVGDWAPVRFLLGRTLRNANAELMALRRELEYLAPRLALIRAPVVIVHGSADDRVPFATVAYLQRMLTGSRRVETVVLEGANHFLPWNAADAVRRAIARVATLSC